MLTTDTTPTYKMKLLSQCIRYALAGRACIRESATKHYPTSSLHTRVGQTGTLLGRVHLQNVVVGRMAPFAPGIASSWVHMSSKRLGYEDTSKQASAMAVQLWKGIKEVKSSPQPALRMCIGSLIPFAGAPLSMLATGLYCPSLAFAQLAYGVAVMSFNGGVSMGMSLPKDSAVNQNLFNFAYAAVPALVGAASLLFAYPLSFFTAMATFGYVGYLDLKVIRHYSPWYRGMRLLTATVAFLSMLLTLLFSMVLRRERPATIILKEEPASEVYLK